MSTISKEPPECFGVLAIVFPDGSDGLRHSPGSCLTCPSREGCLRQAMQSEGGLQVQEKNLDKAYSAGLVGFWSRWSRKKVCTSNAKAVREEREKQLRVRKMLNRETRGRNLP